MRSTSLSAMMAASGSTIGKVSAALSAGISALAKIGNAIGSNATAATVSG